MKIACAKKNSAFAVIIALVAVTVLTLLAGAFAYAMKIETRLAANTNDDEQFYWMGRGGVERACWWLALEGNQSFSSKQQYWAGGPGDGAETNPASPASILGGEALDNFPIGAGNVSLTMTELESKININSATGPLLQQVLTAQGADANDISIVSDSILDWIDPDDATRPAGAESDFYLGLTPSYNAKNAPIDNLDELQLVKGVTRAMFYGGSSAPNNTPFPEHKLGFGHAPSQEPSYAFGLQDVFTPFSSGKVNLLTANANVKLALFDNDANLVQTLDDRLNSDPPIRNIPQLLTAAGISPQAQAQIQPYVDVRGSTYEIHATATIGQLSHEYTAVVFRTGPNVTVFSFYRSK